MFMLTNVMMIENIRVTNIRLPWYLQAVNQYRNRNPLLTIILEMTGSLFLPENNFFTTDA